VQGGEGDEREVLEKARGVERREGEGNRGGQCPVCIFKCP